MEGHDAGMLLAVDALPGDALIGHLLGDRRVKLALTPAIFTFQ